MMVPSSKTATFPVIMTQGPLENTAGDFWRMICETGAVCIAMLTEEKEQGREKCHSYWPKMEGEVQSYGDFDVENDSVQRKGAYNITALKVTDTVSKSVSEGKGRERETIG